MRRIAIVVALCVLFAAGPALAQTPPPPVQTPPAQTQPAPPPLPVFPADAKIGFINLQAVVEQSALGKASSERLRKYDTDKQAELQAQAKELEDLRTKLNTQRDLLNQDALAAMAKDIDLRARKLQFDQESAQSERDQLQQELLQQFNQKVIPEVEKIREARGLWMIFSVADAGIVAAHAGLDLSAELVKALDAIK
jgi:Skp family chaperone for outer membrane proteins